MSVDIEAETIGHDLRWGTSEYSRSSRIAAAPAPVESETFSASGPEANAVEPAIAGSADPWSAPLADLGELDQTPF